MTLNLSPADEARLERFEEVFEGGFDADLPVAGINSTYEESASASPPLSCCSLSPSAPAALSSSAAGLDVLFANLEEYMGLFFDRYI